ncbi:hypothetical protein N7478_004014 [Penicillium angulare]|uniref:uncharacterized protein n=1 Tax=Penicillium angulare TaxID=116970 RepID=UPI0025409DF7|nr:uncharacterized protein N7478_004014 [Penicillium angulare]KAJ5278642.1 hypothetical protein N7478_004014 [Penicillium angulare]
MEDIVRSKSSNCDCCRSICRSSAAKSTSQRRRSQPGTIRQLSKSLGSFYHTLLIIILIICLLPVSSVARPTAIISDLVQVSDIPQSASSSTINTDLSPSLHEGSSPTEPRDNNPMSEDDIRHEILRRGIVTANTNDTSDSMPEPFDTSSNNFANSSCVNYFNTFLANKTVTNCHAVSLLLENSNKFFHDLSSASATSRVLDTTCSEPAAKCQSIMTEVANAMLRSENCGTDYNANNSVVTSTYTQLMAFEPVYQATCLTDPDTQDYCFVDAVTNATAPNDYNVYFIPIGNQLSKGTLTCNRCLKATMNIYAKWATVDNQALDSTYIPSAKIVNDYCGAGFANTTIHAGTIVVKQSAAVTGPLPNLSLAASILGFIFGAISLGLF